MDINLLPNVAKFQADKVKFSRKMVGITVSVTSVWVALLAVVMILYWINRLNFTRVEGKYKTLLADYLTMSEGVIINQSLRYKSKLVSQVLDTRFEYGQAFKKVRGLFGDEIRLINLELKEKKKFSLSGELFGGQLMDGVERKVVDINEGFVEGFLKANIKNVINEGDVWKFDLEVELL